MHEFLKLIRRLKVGRRYMTLLLLRSPFDVVWTYMQASLLRSVFSCLETGSAGRLAAICAGWGLLCAMLFLYNGTVWSVYAAFSAKTEARLQTDMTNKILSLPYRTVQGRYSGEWLTMRNNDIQAVITMMNGPLNIPHWVTALLNTVLSSALMLRCSPVLFFVTLAFILPYLLVSHGMVLRRLPLLKEESRSAMTHITTYIEPLVTEAEAIAVYDAGDMMLRKCEQESRRLLRTNMKMHLRRGLGDAVSRLFGIGGYLAVLFTGFTMISGGTMTFSELVYCLQMRGAVLSGPLMLITCMSNIKVHAVCAKKVNEALEESFEA